MTQKRGRVGAFSSGSFGDLAGWACLPPRAWMDADGLDSGP
jgi:hypothetical protein